MMKKTIFIIIIIMALPQMILSQQCEKTVFKYNNCGILKSVYFSTSDSSVDIPKSADEFFNNILKIKDTDRFIKNTSANLEDGNEAFDQYYKDVKIDQAGYSFHYDKNGMMNYAHGNYMNITDINTKPSIDKDEATNLFIKYLNPDKDLAKEITTDLIIKDLRVNEDKDIKPLLVYRVSVFPMGVIGYVDAQNGNIMKTESAVFCSSSSGWFETKYNGIVYASTDYNNNKYQLYDNSRGAVIQTLDMNGSNNISNAGDITDNDNYWHQNERINNTGIALDVHWALQKIYDRLYVGFNKNSMNNNGNSLIAYTDANMYIYGYGYTKNNAVWSSGGYFQFGSGPSYHNPFTELDIVAHEYGHGITQYQIGWGSNEQYLNEGLSDIWGCIMEYRFGPSGSSVWKIGDQLLDSTSYANCMRNIEYPNSSSNGAIRDIAGAYLSTLYNNTSYPSSIPYIKSGVFSHWFYLLVEGGSGTNENGHGYSVSGIGMDLAEQLIVKAVYNGYLRYTTSYSDVRESIIAAAKTMNNSNLVKQVKNAWNAVDVWADDFTIEGSSVISSQSVYSVDDVPDAYSVGWSLSNSYYNANCLQEDTPSANECTINRSSSQDMSNATLTAVISYNGTTLATITKTVYAHAGFKGTYYNGQTTKQVNLPYPLYVRPNTNVLITSPNLIGATVSYSGSVTPGVWNFNSSNGTLTVGMPSANNSTVVVNVNCDNGDSYYLPIIVTTNNNLLSINVSEGYLNISVTPEFEDGDEQRSYINNNTKDDNLIWSVEIFNATTGECVHKQKAEGDTISIDTSGWEPGVYIVRVAIGEETLTEKVVVK